MQITVNGEPREVGNGLTIAQLIEQLKLPTKYFAVEVNLQVVPRCEHDRHHLKEGDRLEVVTLVGGG